MKILVLEPYYDGSHRQFIQGLQQNLGHELDLYTLPARKWKWRMRLAGPYFAEKLHEQDADQYDCILCSSLVDVAAFRSLAPVPFRQKPVFTYFHENQFAYPVQIEDERDFHFGLTNLTSFLASDRVAFNSRHNLDTFIQGVEKILRICPDMKLDHVEQELQNKPLILHPGVDFNGFSEQDAGRKDSAGPLTIVWNHRWEHDKNPGLFFETLYGLNRDNTDFRLIVMGQSFQRQPGIFAEAKKKLAHRIDHFGFVESRKEYINKLYQSDIVLSTATHEFYGISIIEAVRAGCSPLLPDKLSYPELFPGEYLYREGELYSRLKDLLEKGRNLDRKKAEELTCRFTWETLKDNYVKWFQY